MDIKNVRGSDLLLIKMGKGLKLCCKEHMGQRILTLDGIEHVSNIEHFQGMVDCFSWDANLDSGKRLDFAILAYKQFMSDYERNNYLKRVNMNFALISWDWELRHDNRYHDAWMSVPHYWSNGGDILYAQ